MWNLNELKSELKSNPQIKSWMVTQENVHRRERYFMMDSSALAPVLVVDQDRDVHSQNIQVKIAVKLPNRPDRQGEITKKLFQAAPLKAQIDSAVEAALQTDHKAWNLPVEIPSNLPSLQTTDPRMAEDLNSVTDQVSKQISRIVSKKKDTSFNSAELFLSVHDREFHLSNGLSHRSSQSRIYIEAAYSFAKKNSKGEVESDEYLNTRWGVNIDDLGLEQMFDETSDRAQHSLGLEKPITGKYPVIVDADVLSNLFFNHVSLLSSANTYNELPSIAVGADFIPECHGDLMTVTLDPSLAFGGDTTSLSEQGIVQKAMKIVDKNKVINTLTDKQYADYLNKQISTSRGNVVVEPGNLSYAELTQHSPKVLEILQFSGLFVDPYSGTFSSEIRLARVFDNAKGTVTYLKGGSLSGSIRDNFKGIRLSKNRVKRAHFDSRSSQGQGYFGPDYALLSDVSIVG